MFWTILIWKSFLFILPDWWNPRNYFSFCLWNFMSLTRQCVVMYLMFDYLRKNVYDEVYFSPILFGLFFTAFASCMFRFPMHWPHYEIWIFFIQVW
jgi:hypothetical protein